MKLKIDKQYRSNLMAAAILVAFILVVIAIGLCLPKEKELLQGQVELTDYRISSKLPERVVKFYVQEGDLVHKGDTLVIMQAADIGAKLAQAEAAHSAAQAMEDEANNGAHRDMHVPLFEASAYALQPYFAQCVRAGSDREALRTIGKRAEAAMLQVTGGVNTHRGAIYCFGLTLGALGASLFSDDFPVALAALTQNELAAADSSHGGQAFLRYGAGGARAEAQSGFVHARMAAKRLDAETPSDVLLWLMSQVTDTNVLYRTGEEGASFLREQARQILRLPASARPAAHAALDAACIARGISAGGCADLLALALFLHDLSVPLALWQEL